jgi:hypothetical protein
MLKELVDEERTPEEMAELAGEPKKEEARDCRTLECHAERTDPLFDAAQGLSRVGD